MSRYFPWEDDEPCDGPDDPDASALEELSDRDVERWERQLEEQQP